MIQVEAPADLAEGYEFSAEVDGKIIPVTVPAGGVKQGQIFSSATADEESQAFLLSTDALEPGRVNSNHAGGARTSATNTIKAINIETEAEEEGNQHDDFLPSGPMKRWRRPALSWFYDSYCLDHPAWWMSWCCTPVLVGQVMQRVGLNAIGRPTADSKHTCKIVTTIWLVLAVISHGLDISIRFAKMDADKLINKSYGDLEAADPALETLITVSMVFSYALLIYKAVSHAFTRNAVRRRYEIPPDVCVPEAGACEDLVCGTVCCPCSALQLARHTQNYEKYRYSCSRPAGLVPTAKKYTAPTAAPSSSSAAVMAAAATTTTGAAGEEGL